MPANPKLKPWMVTALRRVAKATIERGLNEVGKEVRIIATAIEAVLSAPEPGGMRCNDCLEPWDDSHVLHGEREPTPASEPVERDHRAMEKLKDMRHENVQLFLMLSSKSRSQGWTFNQVGTVYDDPASAILGIEGEPDRILSPETRGRE